MHITIANACKTFAAVRALDGVSLEIAEGEIFFLLGPSGCGKTTLLRAIAGFQDLDSGSIAFDDRDMTDVPPHERNTGMMFQGYALWPHMTVAENVAFGLEQRALPKAECELRTRRALDQVRIADLADRKPHQLSGGQQQRVALARTLVVEPACLLLDEPLANLDAKLRLEMRGEIRRLCKESGLTAIYVTHDQKEALSVADRLAIMHQGKVLQCGAPRDVYHRPIDAFVAEFIGETNFLAGKVVRADPRQATVETTCGRLQSRTFPADLAVGQTVTVSVRPEAFTVLRPAEAAPDNLLTGTIRDTVYLGSTAYHLVEIATGVEVSVLELNPGETAAQGMTRRLGVAPRDVVLLPARGLILPDAVE